MPLPPVTPKEAEHLGEIYAKAGDQYLISYLILTRFPETNPYALGFVFAHCIEVSVKAVIFHRTKQAPPTGQKGHRLDELLELLPYDLKTELESHLPDPSVREHFLREVKDMHQAPPLEMLRRYFAINPESDDDVWMMLYAMYFSGDIRYGADARRNVLQLMPSGKPRLNKALRLIACARERFPYNETHRRTLAEFVDKLPTKYNIVAEVQKLVETGTAEDTPAYFTGDAPAPPLLFDKAELNLLRQTFGLASKPPG
jgi:hypothetical protein